VFVDGLSLISPGSDVRRKAVQRLSDLISVTAEVGAEMIASLPDAPVGYLPGKCRTNDEWTWAIGGYQQLGDVLANHRVTLAIEPMNRLEKFFLNTAADAVALAEQVGHTNVGILYDTFHAYVEKRASPLGSFVSGDVLVLEGGQPSLKTHCTGDFLFEGCCFKVAYALQILFLIDIAEVACGLVIPEWVEI
jgi:predicted xylose isomerase-like sugar epimerase